MTDERPAMAPSLMKRRDPAQPGPIGHDRDRIGDVELGVRHDAGRDAGDQDVEHGADQQRADDADRHVPLRVLGLLRRGAHRVEADVGEEDHAGAGHHPAPAEGAPDRQPVGTHCLRRNERVPVGRVHRVDRADDEEQHHRDLHDHDHVVDVGRLLDADHQQRGDDRDDDDGGQVEDRGRPCVPSARVTRAAVRRAESAPGCRCRSHARNDTT